MLVIDFRIVHMITNVARHLKCENRTSIKDSIQPYLIGAELLVSALASKPKLMFHEGISESETAS